MVQRRRRNDTHRRDVLVVGGGIFGTSVAGLLAQIGHSVSVLRLSDGERPRADTLRNQAWLQSGFLYASRYFSGDSHRKRVAEFTLAGGTGMLRQFGMAPRSGPRALVAVKAAGSERADLLARAQELDMIRQVNPVPANAARRRLGALFDRTREYLEIPDEPFDEGVLLGRMRSAAQGYGVAFTEVPVAVSLSPDPMSPSGVAVHVGGQRLAADLVLLAAGVGNIELLRLLGVDAPFVLEQTPLLVTRQGVDGFRAPLLIDLENGYSVVTHQTQSGENAYVIGARVRSTEVPFVAAERRRISESTFGEFERALPAALLDAVRLGRFTAGMEPVPTDKRHSRMEPWIRDRTDWPALKTFPGLVVGFPGRATVALLAAQQAAARIAGLVVERLPAGARSTAGSGVVWDGAVYMHFEDVYTYCDGEWPWKNTSRAGGTQIRGGNPSAPEEPGAQAGGQS